MSSSISRRAALQHHAAMFTKFTTKNVNRKAYSKQRNPEERFLISDKKIFKLLITFRKSRRDSSSRKSRRGSSSRKSRRNSSRRKSRRLFF